jgi:hypothetical protein
MWLSNNSLEGTGLKGFATIEIELHTVTERKRESEKLVGL